MTVKEYLGQAYLLDQRINSYTIECEELRLMAEEDEGYVLRFKCLELWDKLSQKCSQS